MSLLLLYMILGINVVVVVVVVVVAVVGGGGRGGSVGAGILLLRHVWCE